MINHIPVTLAAIDNFFGVIIFVIAFISWVVNLIKQSQEAGGNQQGPRRPARPPQNRNRDVQGEIDEFLTQSRRRPSDNVVSEEEIEVVSSPKQRRRPPRRRKSRQEVWEEQTAKKQQQPQRPQPPQPQQASRPGESLSQRHLDTQRNQSAPPLQQTIAKELPHSIDESVAAHLKQFAAAAPTSSGERAMAMTTNRPTTKASIAGKLLKSQNSIRDAIILNEILSPPKARRS